MNPAAGAAGRGRPARNAGDRTGPTTGPVPGNISDPPNTPAEGWNGPGTNVRGERRARPEHLRSGAGLPQHPATAPEHIICTVCGGLIEDRNTARVWMAPDNTVAAADLNCLVRLGEHELGLDR